MDITDRKRSESERQDLRQEALAHAGRVTMLGQLASSLAHELGQPLGAILRNAETAEVLLESDSPDLEELRAIVTDIRKDDHRAGDVIARLRTLLKRQSVQSSAIAMDQLVSEVVALAGFDASTRRIRLTANVPADLPPVRGDRVHLQQVLLNLIINGMDAIGSEADGNRDVKLDARRNGDGTIEIAVCDSGHGVPPEKLGKVFEPFFTTKPNGMGMGLSISRTIVEAHGGRIWVENNADRGATFRFTLCAADAGVGA
jgi:C4-dicarboxylate-specific signal transduction histidine kinase